MTEDNCPRVSSSESDSSTTKQRKRRKWDQPDESLVSSAGVAVPRIFPMPNMGSLARRTLPTVSSVIDAPLAIPFSTSIATPLQVVQAPLQQHAAAILQKLVQPKIQDELIAREIVINDADPAIRYKLTKRQTQEEIQKSTGAVVITRGKYRPPNVPPDGEKPLYLHISAAVHLETTVERIKAVDQAAAMVEEMLKQATMSNGVKVDHLLSTCVFLGFEPGPSLDIISRIRGPNDQYVNHIMNETGATVLIRGRGSDFPENGKTEETQQPLHLLLSSNNTKSLQHAKLLAENLLDTICGECGASRISSCKVYGAVPPPSQLQVGVQIPTNASKVNDIAALSSTVSLGQPQAKSACYPQGLTSGTNYNGYCGIYSQATPLQHVALALRQSTSPVTATVAPTTTTAESTDPQKEVHYLAKNKRSQKRKFQELPIAAKGPPNPNQVFSLTFYEAYRLILDFYVGHLYVSQGFLNLGGMRQLLAVSLHLFLLVLVLISCAILFLSIHYVHHFELIDNKQESEFRMPRELTSNVGARDISSLQDRKSFVKPLSNEMPPPPPKFDSTPKLHGDNTATHVSKSEVVPDTLIKLMEYGDDDDETEEMAKPFWAVQR
ncbi:hypothetical protein CASFOL_032866 [Castilleja foliolosa]|uniref:Protein RIK n=1 Tax=Castilleja foliolosa TaxID=1961234 RepID=A0ABD3C2Q8_9LAMI